MRREPPGCAPRRTTLDDVLSVVLSYLADRHPGQAPSRLIITLATGEKALDVLLSSASASRHGQRHGQSPPDQSLLTDAEREILQAVRELGGEPSAKIIGRHAGGAHGGRLRVLLASLRERHLLGGLARGRGYPLTSEGAAALDQGSPLLLRPALEDGDDSLA